MQGYSAAPRVKLACKQYACDAQTRDSRSGADAHVIRHVFGVLLVCGCCPVTVWVRSGVGGLRMRDARDFMYCTLRRLEYMPNTDDLCPWDR